MVMKLGVKPVYPLLPQHALKFHLGTQRVVRFGQSADVLCGDDVTIGIGARRVSADEWSKAHESLRCQRCVASFRSRGGTTS